MWRGGVETATCWVAATCVHLGPNLTPLLPLTLPLIIPSLPLSLPPPAGSLLVSAGGNQLCIWDLVGGGRLLRRLTNFQKTVTCVELSPLAGPDSAAAPRMLAGSLDGHVKVS